VLYRSEIPGGYHRVQSAEAEILRARHAAGRTGQTPAENRQVLLVADRGESVSPLIRSLLAERGVQSVVLRADAAERPDPASQALIVIAGAGSYASARARSVHEHELSWVRAADAAGTTVLGIGHGARVLADALGGEIEKLDEPYRGWAFVDTVAPHQIAGGPWPSWQQDVIRLPSDARVIAHNRLGPQAFQLGRHVGVQFHPEATRATIARWASDDVAPVSITRAADDIRRDPAAAAVCARRLFTSILGLLEIDQATDRRSP
jgi:GMP synthase (glutamine-hydrolysing)